jgi:hypothetical protein
VILLKCCQIGVVENLLDQAVLNADDLADKVAEVLDYFG